MRRFRLYLFALMPMIALSWCLNAAAQEDEAPTLESANALYAAGDWAGAARAFRAVTEAEPDNGAAWLGLASGLYNSRQVDPAIEAYRKALDLGFQPPRTMLLLARSYAAKGEDEAAIEWLAKAAETGTGLYPVVTSTEEFRRLYDHPEFQKIVEQIRPCNTPAHHLLDFWVGSWTVVVGEDKQEVGKNTVARILNGCAIIENWTDAGGSEGKSLFYFHDPSLTWKQVWVTDGQQIKEKHLIAQLGAGILRFQGELQQRNGRLILDRTTLVPVSKNRVRQIIEQSADGGETWRLAFDALYLRAGTEEEEEPPAQP